MLIKHPEDEKDFTIPKSLVDNEQEFFFYLSFPKAFVFNLFNRKNLEIHIFHFISLLYTSGNKNISGLHKQPSNLLFSYFQFGGCNGAVSL